MTRINTNISSLVAQQNLRFNNNSLETSLERLSTGFRINSGKDDPAGLIASENLRSELSGISAAINNADRANQVLNIAEGGLQEVSRLLEELQGLVVNSANDAGLSGEEKEANQLQIDSILDSIDRISQTVNFQGVRLLDGTFDFQTSGQGVDDLVITNAKNVTESDPVDVKYNVTQSAQTAGLQLTFSSGGNAINLNGSATATEGQLFTFEVAGVDGSREFSFASGTTVANAAADINEFTDVTGVSATASGGNLILRSDEFGSSQFVSVRILDAAGSDGTGIFGTNSASSNTFTSTAIRAFSAAENSNAIRREGQDVAGTINGIEATGDGKEFSLTSDFLSLEFTLTDTQAQQLSSNQTAVSIYGGGANFSFGSDVNLNTDATIGIRSVASRNLGSTDGLEDDDGNEVRYDLADLRAGRDLDVLDGDLQDAQQIVSKAISQVATLRGQIGAFQANTIQPAINSLNTAFENTSAAESQIRDTDFARETANLTRNQILVNATISSLGVANVQPANVLSLIG